MARVEVPVLKPLTYQGRSYVRGDILAVEAVEALVLSRAGKVTLTRDVVVEPAKVETPEPRRRRIYRRRDMTAEPAAE